MGDYNQHLLKMRLQGGLEGVELGPILGRGSFGRVYKGAVALGSLAWSVHRSKQQGPQTVAALMLQHCFLSEGDLFPCCRAETRDARTAAMSVLVMQGDGRARWLRSRSWSTA